MNKIVLFSLIVGSYMFAGIHGEIDDPTNQSNVKQYNWAADTSDDDDTRYRGKDELAEARLRDPLVTFPEFLKRQGFVSDQEIDQINNEAQILVNDATDFAESAPSPDPSGMLDFVYAP